MLADRVPAFWCRVPSRPNFGDALTPWLIGRLTGRAPRFVDAADPRPKYLVTGSVIELARAGTTVWGAGLMRRGDAIAREATLLAVRGPLTRARALACGCACPDVLGDPGLLLPRLYRPPRVARAGIGVVPHFSDLPRIAARWQPSAERRLIDIQAPIERVIDEIAACELVASSSLHGIITAHAYGVPAVWLKFRDLPSGDDTKFADYLLSIGAEPRPVHLADDALDARAFAAPIAPPPAAFAEPLWRARPFPARAEAA